MLPGTVERWRPLAARVVPAAAAREGAAVPVELVLALIAQESGGRADATRTEPDGRVSRGLMQLLDGTAHALGYQPWQMLSAPYSIEAGTRYLARQLKRYGGNVPRAVAAYNAGSARFHPDESFVNQPYVDSVLKWLKKAGGAVASASGLLGLAAIVGLGWALWRSSKRRAAGHAAPRATIAARW